MSNPDYILDLSSVPTSSEQTDSAQNSQPKPLDNQSNGEQKSKPWIAIKWKCCGTYSRVYRNREGTAYEGRCPKCMKPVKLKIGPGGTSDRFFEAN